MTSEIAEDRMTEQMHVPAGARLLAAGDGGLFRGVGGVSNRFMIDGKDTDGRFALVQHLFQARALAAPMHRHHDEDEYTHVSPAASARYSVTGKSSPTQGT